MSSRGFNSTFGGLPTTIFELMSQLAARHGSINLGQGFPDNELEGPASMKEAAYQCVGGMAGGIVDRMGIRFQGCILDVDSQSGGVQEPAEVQVAEG